MIPAKMFPIDQFPKNVNGKVNRNELKEKAISLLHFDEDNTSYEEFVFETYEEKEIAEIWKQIIKCTHISSTDNFFSMGGNSIKALQLINKVNERFHTQLSIGDIFKYNTVSQIARLIREKLLEQEFNSENGDI